MNTQHDASTELDFPDFPIPPGGQRTPIVPGVEWVRMPLPFALDHINLWLLEDDQGGLCIVDTGFALDEVRQHWQHILEQLGRPVQRILVTHFHPDHMGLAAWLQERCGAEILATHGEFAMAHAVWAQLPGYAVGDMLQQFRAHGLDAARLNALEARGNAYRRGVPSLPSAYRRLLDGDTLRIGDHEWQVLIGHGHAPEHVSLYCASLGVLISGDMLLPRISTNVSVWAATPDDDPLGRFLHSLNQLRHLPVNTLVLPSHGRPFRGIAARVHQLEQHHQARCAELLAACCVPRSAQDLLATLFPRELDTHQVMFAMGEAIAHLNHLEARGMLTRSTGADGIVRYTQTA